jgi:hypothetical protein
MSSNSVDQLISVVAELTTVELGLEAVFDHVASRIRGIASQILDQHAELSVTDVAKGLQTIADGLGEHRPALVSAVVANTVAAPPPAEPETDVDENATAAAGGESLEAASDLGNDSLEAGSGNDTLDAGGAGSKTGKSS